MKKFILAIDQGTTSSRAILFDHEGHAYFMAQREVTCLFPHSGWVEADALAIWVSVIDVTNEVLVKANAKWSDIDSIGVTNQRETTIVWDKKTVFLCITPLFGNPVNLPIFVLVMKIKKNLSMKKLVY